MLSAVLLRFFSNDRSMNDDEFNFDKDKKEIKKTSSGVFIFIWFDKLSSLKYTLFSIAVIFAGIFLKSLKTKM